MQDLDQIDRRVLRLLQNAPDQPMAQLAQMAGISAGACLRRVARMEQAGLILGHTIEIDYAKLGWSVQVFLRITLDKTSGNAFDRFLDAARTLPEIDEIQTLLGRVDIRLSVRARDLAHYQQIYRERILTLPHIAEIEALMLVSEIKNNTDLPI